MLPCDRPEKPKKIYIIPKVSKKRQAAIDAGTWKPKPPKPIKPRGDRRAKQERQYLNKTRPELLAKYPICQAQVKCRGLPATECHHTEGRIEDLLNDKSKIITCCNACHHFAEMNPEAAKELKISGMRTNN